MSFNPQHSQIAESAGMLAAIANDLSLLESLAQRYKVNISSLTEERRSLPLRSFFVFKLLYAT